MVVHFLQRSFVGLYFSQPIQTNIPTRGNKQKEISRPNFFLDPINKQTVLVYQHPNADSAEQKSVEKILDMIIDGTVAGVRFTHFQNSLGNRRHNVHVTITHPLQTVTETV